MKNYPLLIFLIMLCLNFTSCTQFPSENKEFPPDISQTASSDPCTQTDDPKVSQIGEGQRNISVQHPSDTPLPEENVTSPEIEKDFINPCHPIIIGCYLIGGSSGDTWLGALDKKWPLDSNGLVDFDLVIGGEKYKLYSQNGYTGDYIGSRARFANSADGSYEVKLTALSESEPESESESGTKNSVTIIAINGEWNALPHKVERIDSPDGYETIVKNQLKKKGILDTPIPIKSVISADLDNDGIVEELIWVSNF